MTSPIPDTSVTSDIHLRSVTKSFGHIQVLKNIDLDVASGEVVVLIGASGSGKSTILRIMSGLETADSGEVNVGGVPMHDPKRAREIRGHVGMVFQQFNLFPHLDALGNVTLALRKSLKLKPAQARAVGMAALERVGMQDRSANYPTSSPEVSSSASSLRWPSSAGPTSSSWTSRRQVSMSSPRPISSRS